MQQDISTSHGGRVLKYISSANFDQSEGFDYASLYSSMFPQKTSLLSVLIPSDYSTDDDTNNNMTASPITADYGQTFELTSHSPQYSPFRIEHEDLVDRHNRCLSHIGEAAREAEALRQENINLRMANINLNKRLSLLVQAAVQNGFVLPSDYTTSFPSSSSSSVMDSFRRMCIGETATSERQAWDEVSDESPTSVIESDRVERMDVDRVSLPKSISVRSSGYLKAVQTRWVKEGQVRAQNRIKTVNPFNGKQKVYVPGGKQEERPVELEVYNQGMIKTELCNKWQMTGSCPYGDHCQFAHGIGELRPVIRHPRYKTEVCRMILAGDPCPYGHRCHFRHTLTDQERLLRPLKATSVNLVR